jgi:hypothetical protein
MPVHIKKKHCEINPERLSVTMYLVEYALSGYGITTHTNF